MDTENELEHNEDDGNRTEHRDTLKEIVTPSSDEVLVGSVADPLVIPKEGLLANINIPEFEPVNASFFRSTSDGEQYDVALSDSSEGSDESYHGVIEPITMLSVESSQTTSSGNDLSSVCTPSGKGKKKKMATAVIGNPSKYLLSNNPPPRSTRNSSKSLLAFKVSGAQKKSKGGTGRTKSVVSQ